MTKNQLAAIFKTLTHSIAAKDLENKHRSGRNLSELDFACHSKKFELCILSMLLFTASVYIATRSVRLEGKGRAF